MWPWPRSAVRITVLSGKADAVDAIAQLAAMAGRRMEELDTPQAFHSPLVDPILAALRGESIRSAPPKVPLVSTMTGGLLDGAVADEYWSMQARQPVLFYQAIRRIL